MNRIPLLPLSALLLTVTPAIAGAPSAEHAVKAAFVFNFAKLTSFSGSGALVVGIIGSGETGQAIAAAIDGKDAGGRKIQVKNVSSASGCQLVFVNAPGGPPSAGSGTLVVGESGGFATKGGHIGFTMTDGKVRFDINVKAIKKAGLDVDSKIVAIGNTVG